METTENQPVIVTVTPPALLRYLEASHEIELLLGLSPGPEFLMSLAVEHEDPSEFSTLYIGEIISALREPESAS